MKKTFELRSPQIKQNAISFIQQIPDDHKHPMIVTIQEQTRSLEQNKRLWGTLTDIARQVEWHGRYLSAEQWKWIFGAALHKQEVVPGIDGGFVVLGQSTSRMSIREMSDMIELMNSFGAERNVQWGEDAKRALEWTRRFGDKREVA